MVRSRPYIVCTVNRVGKHISHVSGRPDGVIMGPNRHMISRVTVVGPKIS